MYYVTATDQFMSGWGHSSGKTNKLVFECQSYNEALTVYSNCIARSDFKHVNICTHRPRYYRSTMRDYTVGHYYVQNKDKEEYPNFYEKGYFSK